MNDILFEIVSSTSMGFVFSIDADVYCYMAVVDKFVVVNSSRWHGYQHIVWQSCMVSFSLWLLYLILLIKTDFLDEFVNIILVSLLCWH